MTMKYKKDQKTALKDIDWRSKTLPITGLVGVVILISLGIMMNLPEESINFNFVENMGMWQVSEGTKFSRAGDSIQLTKGAGQLYLVVPQMNVDADHYDVCVIEGTWPIAFDQGHLLFISPFNKQFDYNFRYDFDTGRAGENNRQYIDLKSHDGWQWIVKGILILPAANAKQVSLKGIRFIHANPWSKIRAWWSAFTRYYDPLLGTCFAMATPIFTGKPFNPFVVPILWIILAICGIIVASVHLFKADPRITKISAGICLAVIIIAWGLLDLRNNIVYLKAIARNKSLYWGKSIQEKRGIVVGDPEFIDFMKFCDENIPLNSRIYGQIPADVPGVPTYYLPAVQYYANLRPRFGDPKSGHYFIFYKSEKKENWEVRQEQAVVRGTLVDIPPEEAILQEVKLWLPSNDIFQINLWVDKKDLDRGNLAVKLLAADKITVAGKAEYVSYNGNEAIFRFSPIKNYLKNETMYIQVINQGKLSLQIGSFYGDIYPAGCLIRSGKKIFADLAFRLIYRSKELKLFKRFNDEAYILVDEEAR